MVKYSAPLIRDIVSIYVKGVGGSDQFFDQKNFWAYLIALLFGNNILFTELKNLARSSNGGRRRKRDRSQISAFAIQNKREKQDRGHTFLAFLGVKILSKYTIIRKLL